MDRRAGRRSSRGRAEVHATRPRDLRARRPRGGAGGEGGVAGGWHAASRVPVRPNWNGLLPVPGDGRFEWAGYADPEATPSESNPARGWLATANQFNVHPDPATGLD